MKQIIGYTIQTVGEMRTKEGFVVIDLDINEAKERLKQLRREKRKAYDKWYYENKTKVKRQTLSNK